MLNFVFDLDINLSENFTKLHFMHALQQISVYVQLFSIAMKTG